MMSLGNSGVSPKERQTYWHYRAISLPSTHSFPALALAPSLLGSSSALAELWMPRLTGEWGQKGPSQFCIQTKHSWQCAPLGKVLLSFIYLFIFPSGKTIWQTLESSWSVQNTWAVITKGISPVSSFTCFNSLLPQMKNKQKPNPKHNANIF